MIAINHSVKLQFDFLTKREGFHLESEITNKIIYQSDNVILRLTFNERDGFDVVLLAEDKKISVTTVMDVIKTYKGILVSREFEDFLDARVVENEITQVAQFLKSDGKPILKGQCFIINELAKLRFWHAGEWVNKWGKSIEMSPSDIKENHALIKKIVDYLQE